MTGNVSTGELQTRGCSCFWRKGAAAMPNRRQQTWNERATKMGHWIELFVVALITLLIFGPKRLPEIGGAVGRAYTEFKKSLGEISALGTDGVPAPERQLSIDASACETGAADANRIVAPPHP